MGVTPLTCSTCFSATFCRMAPRQPGQCIRPLSYGYLSSANREPPSYLLVALSQSHFADWTDQFLSNPPVYPVPSVPSVPISPAFPDSARSVQAFIGMVVIMVYFPFDNRASITENDIKSHMAVLPIRPSTFLRMAIHGKPG